MVQSKFTRGIVQFFSKDLDVKRKMVGCWIPGSLYCQSGLVLVLDLGLFLTLVLV